MIALNSSTDNRGLRPHPAPLRHPGRRGGR